MRHAQLTSLKIQRALIRSCATVGGLTKEVNQASLVRFRKQSGAYDIIRLSGFWYDLFNYTFSTTAPIWEWMRMNV